MFERFKSGSYRIEDSELANSKKTKSKSVGIVLIKFLDSSNVKFNLDVSIKYFIQVFDESTNRHYAHRKKPKAVSC